MTLKSLLMGLTALVSFASYASPDSITIGHQNFTPENLIVGEWMGEPIVGSVTNYGIVRLNTAVAFFPEIRLKEITSAVLNFETEQDIHAVHLHGVGSEANLVEIYGYTIIFGDEKTQKYQMETYSKGKDGIAIVDEFSSTSRGALDCGSAAKLAILHGPEAELLTSITLATTDYKGEPQSEEKYASYLTNETALLARARGSLNYVAPFGDDESEEPQRYCGNTSSCPQGSTSCNIIKGAICN